MNKPISIKELSKKCNLSVATISRVINDDTRHLVKKETLALVNEAIKKYNYTPNKVARMLKKSKANTVGILIQYDKNIFMDGYFTEIMSGMFSYLQSTIYDLKIITAKPDKFDLTELFMSNMIDGLIILNWQAYPELVKIFESGKQFDNRILLANNYHPNLKANILYFDNKHWGCKATEFLIEKGCKKIAHIKGSIGAFDSENRYAGYLQALKKHKLKEFVEVGHFSMQGAVTAVKKLLKKHKDIDGIFCANDTMAIAVLKYLESINISVPDKIKVVGFDGISSGKLVSPELTTVDVGLFHYGEILIENFILLLERGEKMYKHIYYEPSFIEKESV